MNGAIWRDTFALFLNGIPLSVVVLMLSSNIPYCYINHRTDIILSWPTTNYSQEIVNATELISFHVAQCLFAEQMMTYSGRRARVFADSGRPSCLS